MERESKCQDAYRAHLGGRATCDAGSAATPARYEREPGEVLAHVLDHRRPGAVKLTSRRRGTPPGHPVRLQDASHCQPRSDRRLRHSNEISSLDAPAGAMAQNQEAGRLSLRR
jgi:hypothetical protein